MANLTSNGNADFNAPASKVSFKIDGTWGGGTMTINVLNPESGNYIQVTDASYTADVTDVIEGSKRDKIRFTLSGATAPNLNISVNPSGQ